MTTPASPSARTGRGLQYNLLWVLAAILGAATIHATTRIVHDTSRRRLAAGLVAQSTAEQLVAGARHRLEVAAALALGPTLAGGAAERTTPTTAAALVHRQQTAERCDCVPLLPASGFFRLAAPNEALDIAMMPDAGNALTPAQRGALERVVRADQDSDRTSPSSGGSIANPVARLRIDPSIAPFAAVTAIARDEDGRPTGVVGLVADRRLLMAALIPAPPNVLADEAGSTDAAPSPNGSRRPSTLARLDDRSIGVRDPWGGPLLGEIDPARRFRATIADSTILGGAAITVALESWQIASPLIAPIASAQIWHLFAVLLGTIIVIVLAVRSSRREAQLASARSDFIAAVSHELRMPLAQILLASETLTMRRERDEQQRQGLASSILREARRLIALVENVLLFSRAGAVELRPHLQRVNVDELFADVRESVQLAVDDSGNTLEAAAPPELGVQGDRILLRQALVNLLDNAMKYGGTAQRIHLLAREASGKVQLLVEDEGRGIPHAERLRVFEPWERLARDQSSERTGTGLGLAVVRQVAAACGGRVWLEETERGGTRAVLELPAALVAHAADAVVRA